MSERTGGLGSAELTAFFSPGHRPDAFPGGNAPGPRGTSILCSEVAKEVRPRVLSTASTAILGLALGYTWLICAGPSFGPGREQVCQTSIIADLLVFLIAGASVSVPVLWGRRHRVGVPT
jgi:cytochrome c biogenesis protein CcdA